MSKSELSSVSPMGAKKVYSIRIEVSWFLWTLDGKRKPSVDVTNEVRAQ